MVTFAVTFEGVDTRIYLRLRPGLVTPYIAEMGVAHHIALYTTEKSPWIFAEVTGSHRFFQ